MVAFEPDGISPETQLDEETTNEVDVRGVSVVWDAQTDDVPNVTYHGCASPYEAMGFLLCGLLSMVDEYGPLPSHDADTDDEGPDDDTCS